MRIIDSRFYPKGSKAALRDQLLLAALCPLSQAGVGHMRSLEKNF